MSACCTDGAFLCAMECGFRPTFTILRHPGLRQLDDEGWAQLSPPATIFQQGSNELSLRVARRGAGSELPVTLEAVELDVAYG